MQGSRPGSDLPGSHSPGACRMAGMCSSHADVGGATEQAQLQKNVQVLACFPFPKMPLVKESHKTAQVQGAVKKKQPLLGRTI